MEDLCDQAEPQGLHRLSFAAATTVAGQPHWSAAQVPASRLRRELNFRNVRDQPLLSAGAESAEVKVGWQRPDAFLAAGFVNSGLALHPLRLAQEIEDVAVEDGHQCPDERVT